MPRPNGSRSFDPLEDTSASTEEQLRRWLRSDSEVSRLTSALTAHGGGVTSANLALDLVLNEIVRQACLATAATGAAIALLKDGDMVCCATTGASAPELGARLDKKSGLSAICLRTGEAQRCDDTVIDARVNAAACRLLGVRSILVMPLQVGAETVGVFEIFSSLPHAFGDRDQQTLQALAGRVLRTAQQANTANAPSATRIAEFPAPSPTHDERDEIPLPRLTSTDYPVPDDIVGYPADIAAIVESAVAKRRDPWMVALSSLVVLIAGVLLVLMIWRLGWTGPAVKAKHTPAVAPAVAAATPQAPASSEPAASGPAAAQPEPAAESTHDQATPEAGGPERKTVQDTSYETPPGGLDVFQNGKRIYHLDPAKGETNAKVEATAPAKVAAAPASVQESRATAKAKPPISDAALVKKEPVVIAKPIPALSRRQAAKAPEQVDSDMAEQFLLDRVEPEYPAAARKKRIQGLVILSALIDKEGRVEDLKVLSGNPELTDAAIAAVRQWKYTPFTKGNKTVPFQTQVKLSFALPN
jgi:TonB family protein